MITGVDYVFYSNKKPSDLEQAFIALLSEKWANPIIEEFERTDSRLELFVAKNRAMNSSFDESAYSLNENGEGCFMLISSKLEQLAMKIKILDIISPESRRNTEAYDSLLALNNVWEYTLVLPSEITGSQFSRDIYDYLVAVIK